MLRKMLITAGGLFLSLLMFATSANATIVSPDDSVNVEIGDVFESLQNAPDSGTDPLGANGAFSHEYTFTALEDLSLLWELGVTRNDSDTAPNTGVQSLTFSWDFTGPVASNITNLYTDANGIRVGDSPILFSLLLGQQVVLTVSGTMYGSETFSGYDFSVSAVPLPPAVIAFASAMFGIGFLGRRKKKLAAEQA
ncbi:MAG: hypothetical protein KAI89_08120 [Emcibacter sp.]|nr:hypothetical protein [Emcibacter sp.]